MTTTLDCRRHPDVGGPACSQNMRALSASELLDAWEKGLGEPPSRRSLALLSASCPGVERQDPALLSIGQRDALLLSLREWAFGSQIACVSACVECGERLEWTFVAADCRVKCDVDPNGALGLEVDADGYRVAFRLPNSLDLAVVADLRDVELARLELLRRCISTAERDGLKIAADQLPDKVVATVVERMSEADPQADLRLDLTCPACSHRWKAEFDIESFFWREINAWAERLLRDVHVLARAYGWREVDILNLSPMRRQLYLNQVHG